MPVFVLLTLRYDIWLAVRKIILEVNRRKEEKKLTIWRSLCSSPMVYQLRFQGSWEHQMVDYCTDGAAWSPWSITIIRRLQCFNVFQFETSSLICFFDYKQPCLFHQYWLGNLGFKRNILNTQLFLEDLWD